MQLPCFNISVTYLIKLDVSIIVYEILLAKH